jgi:hypothetical protein
VRVDWQVPHVTTLGIVGESYCKEFTPYLMVDASLSGPRDVAFRSFNDIGRSEAKFA